jgi:hypothetical protein
VGQPLRVYGKRRKVLLKFALNKIRVGVDEAEITFSDFRDGEAWEKFIAGLRAVPADQVIDSLAKE